MTSKGVLSKKGVIEFNFWDEEEYAEFEELGLVPDYSEKAEMKMEELLKKDLSKEEYSYHELHFLGKMNLTKLMEKSKAAAEEYMDL